MNYLLAISNNGCLLPDAAPCRHNNWSYTVHNPFGMGTTNITLRGYTFHEHLPHFSLVNMNGRLYDNVLCRMLSPDNLVPDPEYTQAYNRYTYCYNNPLKYTDPDGNEPITIGILVGAAIGAYAGSKVAQAKGYDFNNWQTYAYMVGGAAIGGITGGLATSIATSGVAGAKTAATFFSSYFNSLGNQLLSGGQKSLGFSLGMASYNISNNEWNGIWNWGDLSTGEKIGYFLGSMANLNDINNLINQTNATLYTQERYADGSKDVISHTGIVDDATGKNLMSFGPNDNKIGCGGFKDQIGGAKPLGGYKKLGLAVRKGTPDYPVPTRLSKSTSMVVNKHLFSGLRGVSKFIPYQGVSTNCVNMSSIGLWLNGIPNIGIHPYLLHYSIAAYNNGFNPYMLNALSTRY